MGGLFFLLAFLQVQPTLSPRAAIDRALPILQRSATEFVSQRSCFSCHHNALPILTLNMARDRGFEINTAALARIEDKTFAPLRDPDALDKTVQAELLIDPATNDSLLLMAAAGARVNRSLTTAVRASQLLAWQVDGHWATSDFRPPHSSSLFTSTANTIRAIHFFAPTELRTQADRALAKAREWLRKTTPRSTEDAAFRVMGLVWAGAPGGDIAAAKKDLLAMRSSDGGWPQLDGYASDAYSTGESLFALREAGMSETDEAWQRGAQFLLKTQAPDGTWHVHTRMVSPATVSPPYFSTGFPYGKDEFLSYAGTSWAVMALLRSFPDPAPTVLRESPDPEPWMRTALFGTVTQLTALLDNGLSANTKTANGTSLLMMAAPDAQKVKLLLSRGVDVKARGSSGNDALTIAAAYRGTAASLRTLLDAHAEVSPPEEAHVRRPPLVFAAMTGDLENAKLLLKSGADPSDGSPLAEAITFGHADVVRTLIQAGADTGLTESSGVNLLHWATITGRPSVIPLLAKAGVPLNDKDKAGFTPLMYAATIDFGTSAVLNALVTAGADPFIVTPDGRNAFEQAERFQHSKVKVKANAKR